MVSRTNSPQRSRSGLAVSPRFSGPASDGLGFAGGRASVWSAAGLVDDRVVDAMRFILAVSAVCIIAVDPSEPSRLVAVTYAALLLYSVYSAALYAAAAF